MECFLMIPTGEIIRFSQLQSHITLTLTCHYISLLSALYERPDNELANPKDVVYISDLKYELRSTENCIIFSRFFHIFGYK
jgi:hypothetical protein